MKLETQKNNKNNIFDKQVKKLSDIQIDLLKSDINEKDFNDISEMIGTLKEYILNCESYTKNTIHNNYKEINIFMVETTLQIINIGVNNVLTDAHKIFIEAKFGKIIDISKSCSLSPSDTVLYLM